MGVVITMVHLGDKKDQNQTGSENFFVGNMGRSGRKLDQSHLKEVLKSFVSLLQRSF